MRQNFRKNVVAIWLVWLIGAILGFVDWVK